MMSPRPFLFAVAAAAVALGLTTATVQPAFASEGGVAVAHETLDLNSPTEGAARSAD